MVLRERAYWIIEGEPAWAGSPDREIDPYRFYTSRGLQELGDYIASNLPKGFRVKSKTADMKGWKVSLKLTSKNKRDALVRLMTSSTANGLTVVVSCSGNVSGGMFRQTGTQKKISAWVNDRLELD